jgi:hypothetical protein
MGSGRWVWTAGQDREVASSRTSGSPRVLLLSHSANGYQGASWGIVPVLSGDGRGKGRVRWALTQGGRSQGSPLARAKDIVSHRCPLHKLVAGRKQNFD